MAKINFEKLNPEDIECRVKTVKKDGCQILLYKTARVDAKLLDQEVGTENWKNDFKEIGGVLYGGISVWNADLKEWVTKWDCGTESNTEAEKGRASDAFKRAGFKWGIGRELYYAPYIWIEKSNLQKHWETEKTDRYGNKVWACADRFKVTSIAYDGDKVVELVIYNDTNKKKVFELYKPEVPDLASIEAMIKTLKLNDENIESIKERYEVKDLKDMTDEQKIELGEYLGQKLVEQKNEDTKQD